MDSLLIFLEQDGMRVIEEAYKALLPDSRLLRSGEAVPDALAKTEILFDLVKIQRILLNTQAGAFGALRTKD